MGIDVDNITKGIALTSSRVTAVVGGNVAKSALRWEGVPFAAVFLAIYEEFGHHIRKEKLTKEYLPEIAAKLDKSIYDVAIRDMEKVAQQNPAIKEAYTKSETRRNLAIAVNAIACIAGFAALSATGGLLGAAVAFVTVVATDKLLSTVGKKIFGLAEPELKEVGNNPALQSELCLSSQIKYLEGLQNARQPIQPEQVALVFEKAGNHLGSEKITELTQLLNSGRVRAQELAFTAANDSSGVLPLENDRETILEVANKQLQQKLTVAQEQLGVAREKAGEFVGNTREQVGKFTANMKEKLPFNARQLRQERENNPPLTPEAIIENRRQGQQAASAHY